MPWVKNLGITLTIFGCLWGAGCANEESQEQRTADNITRSIARLTRAVGVYRGVLNQAGGAVVPTNLDVEILNNPVNGVDNPMLQGTLTIGLFGGVQIASTSSYFDWGSGNVTFSFSRTSTPASGATTHKGNAVAADTSDGSATGKAIELSANVPDQGGITAVTLVTPRQGTFQLNLTKDAASLLTTDTEFDYAWTTPGAIIASGTSTPADALLTLNLSNQSVTAPANFDLPFLPGLNATVTFSPLGKSPETAKSVIYDPIGGTLELYFTDVSHLLFQNIFLSPSTSGQALELKALDGTVLLGSVNNGTIHANQVSSTRRVPITLLPPKVLRGTYQGSGIAYRTDIFLDYSGKQMLNTLEFPFPVFPGIRAEVVVCSGTEPQRRRALNMVSVDHLNGVAAFQLVGSPNAKDFEFTYSPNWLSIDGYFTEGDGVGTTPPHVMATPRNFDGNECADDPGL